MVLCGRARVVPFEYYLTRTRWLSMISCRWFVVAGARVGIIGSDQVVSDIPAHRFAAFNADRDLDRTARGLGGTSGNPMTTVGAENLTHEEGDRCGCLVVFECQYVAAVSRKALLVIQGLQRARSIAHRHPERALLHQRSCSTDVNLMCMAYHLDKVLLIRSQLPQPEPVGARVRPRRHEPDVRPATSRAHLGAVRGRHGSGPLPPVRLHNG